MIGKHTVKVTKNNGHIFEQEFKKSIPAGVYIKKLKVAGMNFKGGGNEGDYLVFSYPNLFIFELKSGKGKSIPFSNIRDKQILGLTEHQKIYGVKAGFVFNFRELGETYFISIKDASSFIETGERKSFPIDWCREVGIRVEQKLLRVRYKYDLGKLLREIQDDE